VVCVFGRLVMVGLRLPIHCPLLDYTKPGPSRRTRIDGRLHHADVRAIRYHQEAERLAVASPRVPPWLIRNFREIVNTP
jgi:hypothetical protein